MSAAVEVIDHGVRERLIALQEQLSRPEALLGVLGREGRNRLRKHFLGNDKTPNKLGGKRQHFWRQVADSVSQPNVDAAAGEVRLTIAQPAYAQKLYGGPITAKRAKALTIPLTADAYGRAASTFEAETGRKLFLIKSGDKALLASKPSAGSKFLVAEYLLTKSVTQKPDPTALPDMNEFQAGLVKRAEEYVDRLTKRGNLS